MSSIKRITQCRGEGLIGQTTSASALTLYFRSAGSSLGSRRLILKGTVKTETNVCSLFPLKLFLLPVGSFRWSFENPVSWVFVPQIFGRGFILSEESCSEDVSHIAVVFLKFFFLKSMLRSVPAFYFPARRWLFPPKRTVPSPDINIGLCNYLNFTFFLLGLFP